MLYLRDDGVVVLREFEIATQRRRRVGGEVSIVVQVRVARVEPGFLKMPVRTFSEKVLRKIKLVSTQSQMTEYVSDSISSCINMDETRVNPQDRGFPLAIANFLPNEIFPGCKILMIMVDLIFR